MEEIKKEKFPFEVSIGEEQTKALVEDNRIILSKEDNIDSIKESTNKDLYIIHQKGSNYYKIGISDNPEKRLVDLQYMNPNDLELFYVVKEGAKCESLLHYLFEEKVVRNEWFELDINDLFKCICKLLKYYQESIDARSSLIHKEEEVNRLEKIARYYGEKIKDWERIIDADEF